MKFSKEAALQTLRGALAARRACTEVAGLTPDLKWPNDVLAGDRKLAGILAEAVTPNVVVVGLGLNIDWGEVPLPEGATSLREVTGETVDRDLFLAAYLEHLDQGFTLDDYRSACVTVGREVRVDLGTEHVTGQATAVTDEGHLLIETVDGPRCVIAGDVVHVR